MRIIGRLRESGERLFRLLWHQYRGLTIGIIAFSIVISIASILIFKAVSQPKAVGDFPLDDVPPIVLEEINKIDTLYHRYVAGFAFHDAIKEVTKEGTAYYYNVPLILVDESVDQVLSVQEKYELFRTDQMHHNDRFIDQDEVMSDQVFEVFVSNRGEINIKRLE